jgi:hypothetical protein
VISQDALDCNIEILFLNLRRRKFERQECKAIVNEQRNKQIFKNFFERSLPLGTLNVKVLHHLSQTKYYLRY